MAIEISKNARVDDALGAELAIGDTAQLLCVSAFHGTRVAFAETRC